MNTNIAILVVILAIAVGVGVYFVTRQGSSVPSGVAAPTPTGPDPGWQAAGVITSGVASTVGAIVAAAF